ncbi:MAG: VRR-NUC domain-containing protein [Oscillospiraceae bacterium]|nr:VRR-NUC domain-containing protein [Oscillospiraceae bacterium]
MSAKSGKKAVPPHKESFYQGKIIKWLKEQYPHAFVWKAAAGPYSRGGIPDVCMVLDGHFFGFEVKRPEVGRLSKIQEQTIKEINAAGGTAAVVSFPEQVQKIIMAAGIN